MKYSVGQKVKIRSLEWYRDNVNRYGIIECGKYEFFEPMNEYCGKVVTIKRIDDDNYRIDADKGAFCWTDEMIEGLAEEENGTALNPVELKSNANCITQNEVDVIEKAKTYWDSVKDAWVCPEGYQFVDENGNVINATKIVLEKKKKEYPKTYEGCWYVLKHNINNDKVTGYKNNILSSFQKLLICRDAYWKIAGEEMGLGKPWEPTNGNGEKVYSIVRCCGTIKKNPICDFSNCHILEFPTEEMRDAFKENFDKDLEFCKEFL